MLKPRRKIIKKELKKDPYIEFLAKAKNNVDENKRLYMRWALGTVAVIVAVIVASNNLQKSKDAAADSLGKALITLATGDIDNATLQFEFVVDEYDNNESGTLAKYYLARAYFNDKDYLAASSYLNEIADASFKLTQFPVSIYKMRAFIALDDGDQAAAMDYYEQALIKSDVAQQEQNIALDLADVLLTMGDFSRSLKLVRKVLNEAAPRTPVHSRAEELIGRIEFAQSAG
jgi:tetratricopeptide (TPR) repeat protein